FLSNIFSIIFSLEFYHLRDEVCSLQSLCQRGSDRRHVEHAASGRINPVTFTARSSVIYLHTFDPSCFIKTEDLFSVFYFAWIAARHQDDGRSWIAPPFWFSCRQSMLHDIHKNIDQAGLQARENHLRLWIAKPRVVLKKLRTFRRQHQTRVENSGVRFCRFERRFDDASEHNGMLFRRKDRIVG